MRRRTGYELSYSSARCGEIRQTQFKKLRKRGAFFCCSRMLRAQDKSRTIRSHAEFEERGIQLFLVAQSDEFAESAESRKFARFVRGGIARREATHKTSTATEFLSFLGSKVDIVVRSCNNAVMEHRIDVQRDGCKDRGNRHGDKHFQERKALGSRRFNRQS